MQYRMILVKLDTPAVKVEYYHGSRNADFSSFPEVAAISEEDDAFQMCTAVVDEYDRKFVQRCLSYILGAPDMSILPKSGGNEKFIGKLLEKSIDKTDGLRYTDSCLTGVPV